jgi:hypothetical protein
MFEQLFRQLCGLQLGSWKKDLAVDQSGKDIIKIEFEVIQTGYLPADGRNLKVIVYLLQREIPNVVGISLPFRNPDVVSGHYVVAAFRIFGFPVFHIEFQSSFLCPLCRIITPIGFHDIFGRAQSFYCSSRMLPVFNYVLIDIKSAFDFYGMKAHVFLLKI